MKSEILQYLMNTISESILSFQESIKELKGVSDLDESQTIDRDDLSKQGESTDMEMRLNLQLRNAEEDLKAVKNALEQQCDKIQQGALIKTDKRWFFVGVSNPSINVNGQSLISFSTSAPVYKKVEGMKAGDTFKLGDKTFAIEKIY